MREHKKGERLPDLCLLVRQIREAYGDTQEQFAERIGVAPMTISRFERAKQIPKDPDVVQRLLKAAHATRKPLDTACLEEAVARHKKTDRTFPWELWQSGGMGLAAMPISSLPQWRLMHAAAIAILYYPETAHSIERAAGPALAL